MNLRSLANQHILNQPTYIPGKPTEAVAAEFNIPADEIIKLASNENPWGASPNAIREGKSILQNIHLYPDGSGSELTKTISSKFNLSTEQIILGNGSNEIIELLAHVFLSEGDEVIFGEHAFAVYKLVTLLMGASPVAITMPHLKHDLGAMLEAVTSKTKIIFLPSPNNPTGTANTNEEIHWLVENLPDHVILCFDEAYTEYLNKPPTTLSFIKSNPKIVCLRTFSKIYGLAGLRIGYGYGSKEMISLLQKVRQPFNANAVAQATAIAALKDQDWVNQCRIRNTSGLKQLEEGLTKIGLEYIKSSANFILIQVGDGLEVFNKLQKRGIITRPMSKELGQYLRISVGTEHENEKVIFALNEIFKGNIYI